VRRERVLDPLHVLLRHRPRSIAPGDAPAYATRVRPIPGRIRSEAASSGFSGLARNRHDREGRTSVR
jgi:hypothetical protein